MCMLPFSSPLNSRELLWPAASVVIWQLWPSHAPLARATSPGVIAVGYTTRLDPWQVAQQAVKGPWDWCRLSTCHTRGLYTER